MNTAPAPSSLLRHVEAVLFAPKPATRLATLRILVASYCCLYLLARASHLTQFGDLSAAQFKPVGVAAFLSSPLGQAWVWLGYSVSVLSSAAAAVGLRYRVVGPIWGLSVLWVLTYRNCWGMLFHTENLLVLHALILGFAPAADAWAWRKSTAHTGLVSPRYAWPIAAMNWVLVLSYVVAGIAKLRATGWTWGFGDELRSHIAFDAVRKLELGSLHSAFGAALVPHAWLFAPLAGFTLLLEFGAPLALLGGRWALIWAAAAWSFHAGVLALMLIVFPYPLLGLAYAGLFPVEKLVERWLLPKLKRRTAA